MLLSAYVSDRDEDVGASNLLSKCMMLTGEIEPTNLFRGL